jgi:hypothetical protein
MHGGHLLVDIFLAVSPQPPRPPQQFSVRKSVRRFTSSKFAKYEIDRPFFCGRTSPVAAKTFRWKESVGPGKRRRRAIVPAGRPLGAWRTSKRKISSRVDWAKAASESTASICFIFPKEWKYKTISGLSQLAVPGCERKSCCIAVGVVSSFSVRGYFSWAATCGSSGGNTMGQKSGAGVANWNATNCPPVADDGSVLTTLHSRDTPVLEFVSKNC